MTRVLSRGFQTEFGLYVLGEVVLGDEFSPDGSRLWDKETLDKMDKTASRQSLGGLIEACEAVAHRPREIRLIPLLTGGNRSPVSSFPHSDSVYLW